VCERVRQQPWQSFETQRVIHDQIVFERQAASVPESVFWCESVCEKKFPKPAKTGKNWKKAAKHKLVNSISYSQSRKLGNSGVVTTNP